MAALREDPFDWLEDENYDFCLPDNLEDLEERFDYEEKASE